MRTSITRSVMASLAMLTVGFALAGPVSPAFANESSYASSPGSQNVYNPLAPTSAGEVGTVDARMPIIPVGQADVNCHLLSSHTSATCR
jgi:hypothetical protein